MAVLPIGTALAARQCGTIAFAPQCGEIAISMTATHFRCDMAITVMRGSAGQRYRFPFASHHGLVVERYVCRLGGRRVTFIRG